ncbi:hypothetical protein [Haloarchaeobius sp. TZWSO28]
MTGTPSVATTTARRHSRAECAVDADMVLVLLEEAEATIPDDSFD